MSDLTPQEKVHSTPLQQRGKVDSTGLLDDAKRVQETLESPGWKIIEGIIEHRVAQLRAQSEDSFTIPSRSQYAHLSGQLSGLRVALAAGSALVKIAATTQAAIETNVAGSED